jgi:hypothetical protein
VKQNAQKKDHAYKNVVIWMRFIVSRNENALNQNLSLGLYFIRLFIKICPTKWEKKRKEKVHTFL